jgi:hypothetical protein
VTKLGIARAFQNLELFSGLSVLDNLMLARHTNLKYNFLQAMIYVGKASRLEAENRAYVEDIIDFMELEPYRKSTVGNLAYGIQKRVEVARALTLNPQLLLLDEPMAGMNIEEKEDIVRFVMDIKKERRQQSFWLNMIWVLSWIFPIASMCWTSGKSSDRERRKKWLLTKRLSRLTSEKINWTRNNTELLQSLTIPQLLRWRVESTGDKVALREKDFGRWNSYTWNDYYIWSAKRGWGCKNWG